MRLGEEVEQGSEGVDNGPFIGLAMLVLPELRGVSAKGHQDPATMVELVLAIHVQGPLAMVTNQLL